MRKRRPRAETRCRNPDEGLGPDRSGAPFPGMPAPAALLFAPFGLLPRTAADVLFTLLLAICLVAALRLLHVSDSRCYGVAFLWAPVFSAFQTANLTLLLALGLALLWRLRNRTIAA